MTRPDHILIVDDDHEIRRLLTGYLERAGYRTTALESGRELWTVLEKGGVDLVVLDVMLPGEDGLSLCRNVRARTDTPVIMLTARGDETDRIVGLEIGADDYLAKPFNPRELLARIKVILRRSRALPHNLRPDDARRIVFAGWTLNIATRDLHAPDGVVVALGGAEFALLRVFLNHPNRVLTRDQLLELTRGKEADAFDRSMDVRVSRLRLRLRDDAKEPAIIKTVRNEGYVLSTQVEAA
jgi:two-component system OmpR family response regulator